MSGRDVFRLSALAGLGLVVAGIAGVIGGRVLMAAAPEELPGRIAMVGLTFLLIAGLVGWVVWRIMSRRTSVKGTNEEDVERYEEGSARRRIRHS